MPSAYGVYQTQVTAGVPVNLSFLFLQEGVARPSYHNVSWSLIIQDEGTEYYSGGVNPNGSLAQGNAPPGFIFTFSYTCNMTAELIVYFEPDPCQPCDCSNEDPSGQNCCPASPTSPDSVELATGKFVFQKDLLSVRGIGSQGWSFGLNYKSNFDIEGILGKNFAYPQYMYLEQLTGGGYFFMNDVQLVTNQLSRAIFNYYDNESYTSPTGNNTGGTLTRINAYTPSERLILTSPNGTITTFFGFNYFGGDYNPADNVSVPAPGQIESIIDRHGNRQTLLWGNTHTSINGYSQIVYDGTPQLLSVTDSYGRVITYDYYGAESNYRVQQITDFQGRKLNFQYDDSDRLIAVVTPSIFKAAPGNTFLGGTAYVFQYDADNADPERCDDLIRIWYPNQTQPYLNVETRTVDVEAVYANATPRYAVAYGQSPSDSDSYGKVIAETLGDPENEIGGAATFAYTTCSDDLPPNIIDPLIPPPVTTPPFGTTAPGGNPIVSRTIYTDRNGNRKIYDFNATLTYTYQSTDTGPSWSPSYSPNWTVSRLEVDLNRSKNSLAIAPPSPPAPPPNPSPFVTWTKFNAQNRPLTIVYPEGNSTEYVYETGVIAGLPVSPYVARRGLLISVSRLPGNSIGILSRAGSNGQNILIKRYFYDPIFNQRCAVIEERGNPIDGSTYFVPQNGGTPPSNADCSRYATLYTFDYQKDVLADISGDGTLQALLGLDAAQIETLIAYVDDQMKATDGTGGIPTGFPVNLGDINGDGTGSGSGLPEATHLGNLIKITHPSVLQVDLTIQPRIELFTVNLRGQQTTATDPEGNITVTTRYPENDPEGTGQNISPILSTQQYGLIREIHVDANPDDVMSLVGASGDLTAFVPMITRTNTPGIYQDLITRYEGSSGCMTCAYDPMGNVLSQTDPRGFTTTYDRNEMGEIYRLTSPTPYNFRVETSYDSNRNIIQVDMEDLQVKYNSMDPTSAGYGTFTPTGSGTTAHVPMVAGLGGAVRPGWFSNLMTYDLLDNKIEEDIDATGSIPANLVTRYQYDANQNLIKIIKPEGNTIEYDFDERDLKILERVGYFYDSTTQTLVSPGAITAYSYDGNKNLISAIGPVDHNYDSEDDDPGATSQTVYIANAFGLGAMLTVTGDWILQNTYDGFDRVITATDAVGGAINSTYDPTSTLIQKQTSGQVSGATPIDHSGDGNVTLASTEMRYDEALRLYEQQQDVFFAAGSAGGYTVTHTGGGLAANSPTNTNNTTVTLTSGGTSYVLTRIIYDRAGRIYQVLADLQPQIESPAQTTYAYDGANRQILKTDPLGNSVATQFDANGNPVQMTRTEVCTITEPTVGNEAFVSFMWFDCINRPVISGTQGADGNLTTNLNLCCPWMGLPSTLYSLTGYDSRGNKTTVTDPKLNVVVMVYDGASRMIETQQEMRQNGDGRNAPASNKTFISAGGGIIRTEYVYDGNSRLTELVDDRGASTVYAYDLLDRLITKTLADGSVSTRAYDLASCLTSFTDENGTVLAFAYDALSRKISLSSTPILSEVISVGVINYQYDGLSRPTQYQSNDGSSLVQIAYDSINRKLIDYQAYDGISGIAVDTQLQSLVATQVTYSNNIIASNTYDLLYRRTSVAGAYGASSLDTVIWKYFGPSRVVETNWGSNSLIATQMNNTRTHSAVQA